MSDSVKHECGVAFIRLLKPLSFYQEKYGSALYGLNKLYILMQKQYNRGQDGAGVATIKLDPAPGSHYIDRYRSIENSAISEIFNHISKGLPAINEQKSDGEFLKQHVPFMGELLLGHLRYGTHGSNSIDKCHPFIRENNWMSRTLVLAGNFNLTNVDELFDQLVDLGQHPLERADTVTVLEKIGHFLEEEVQSEFEGFKSRHFPKSVISQLIADSIPVEKVLQKATKKFDGGYTIAGMIGHGDAFVFRDPNGIRPAYYYMDDEVVVVTSERPAIQTAFNVQLDNIREIQPGHALIVRKNGFVYESMVKEPQKRTSCSFERIYFSRGNDRDIYLERKKLGNLIANKVLEQINFDIKNTVFSYIPNTAATAFYGMIDGVLTYLDEYKKNQILALGDSLNTKALEEILSLKPRREKIAVKDVKMRTFISDHTHRDELVSHVYDVTYGLIQNQKDTLVVIDDSIVRGTTLRQSILRILDRLQPRKIIIVSSSPQIRYPDCYGIDMSKMVEFVAFQALVALLKRSGLEEKLKSTYQNCIDMMAKPKEEHINLVKPLYDLFSYEEISKEIAKIINPGDIQAEVEVIYQTVENLHHACPLHQGDWYFTGEYPTPGGNKVVNRAFINYYEGNDERAY